LLVRQPVTAGFLLLGLRLVIAPAGRARAAWSADRLRHSSGSLLEGGSRAAMRASSALA
jgi:hypothetical protein